MDEQNIDKEKRGPDGLAYLCRNLSAGRITVSEYNKVFKLATNCHKLAEVFEKNFQDTLTGLCTPIAITSEFNYYVCGIDGFVLCCPTVLASNLTETEPLKAYFRFPLDDKMYPVVYYSKSWRFYVVRIDWLRECKETKRNLDYSGLFT